MRGGEGGEYEQVEPNSQHLTPAKLLFWEVVLAISLAVDVSGRAMQSATERIGISERYRYDVETEAVELVQLMHLASFSADGFFIDH